VAAVKPAIRFSLTATLTLALLAAFDPPVDVFLVLALVAFLALRELAGRGLDAGQRTRVDYMIGVGFIAFLVIVVRRVVEILSA
jgi:hypothetical protein